MRGLRQDGVKLPVCIVHGFAERVGRPRSQDGTRSSTSFVVGAWPQERIEIGNSDLDRLDALSKGTARRIAEEITSLRQAIEDSRELPFQPHELGAKCTRTVSTWTESA